MPNTTRRDLLRAGAAAVSIAAVGSMIPAREADAGPKVPGPSRWDHEYTFGHTELFMQEYHRGTLEILGRLAGERELIGELTSRAAAVIKRGGTVWTSMDLGHMPPQEQRADRRGSPGIMKDHKRNWFDRLKKHDMVFTNYCDRHVLAARERGVYVVCVTVNYVDNEFRPKDYTDKALSNPDGLMLRDVSNVILHSHVPYTQGLVHAPQIPELSICPSSSTGMGAVHWMLNAELANKLADPKAKPVDKSDEYLRILTDRVKQLTAQMPRIREAAVTMAHRIRAGGRWFVKSLEHEGFASEMTHVATGSRIANWGNWDQTKDKNVMLITAISPAYWTEVKLALEKQIEGAFVVAVAPDSTDGVVPPGRLLDIADVGFDSLSPESGGVISVPGRKGTICPTSGVVANILQQMLCAQWVDEMVRRGSVPYFFAGGYQLGGDGYNNIMTPHFERQGF